MPNADTLIVMIVDDQQTIRSLARMYLQLLGVGGILEAGDGEEALKMLLAPRAAPVNLIISDYNMPKLSGLSLLRAVRGYPPTAAIAFIMLTGSSDKELVMSAKQHGVNNYLVKPFTMATLKQKIEAVLGALK
jgi:two-component system, chemotaxis family, chemotaxis protein CheY